MGRRADRERLPIKSLDAIDSRGSTSDHAREEGPKLVPASVCQMVVLARRAIAALAAVSGWRGWDAHAAWISLPASLAESSCSAHCSALSVDLTNSTR